MHADISQCSHIEGHTHVRLVRRVIRRTLVCPLKTHGHVCPLDPFVIVKCISPSSIVQRLSSELIPPSNASSRKGGLPFSPRRIDLASIRHESILALTPGGGVM